ncbi:MAG: rRNA maturation RNase YbeY [Prevotellaceae bacterium]|jgi:rRNA maturation RNase YbeY|nr:rRNA maturation RNase YbeY [Prevotellaceae bacterium]
MTVCFFNENTPFPFVGKKRIVKSQIKSLIEMENKTAGDLCFIFCSDDILLDMNKKHLNHDYYTDVITFDYTSDNTISGDIFISIDRVSENAGKFGTSFDRELDRVMYHGVLHLCGYDDKSENDRRTMREKEDFYLNMLSIIK